MTIDSHALDGVLPGSVVSIFEPTDLAELVVLQRCCWVQEAIANDTLDIPPLHETAEEVLAWATTWTTAVVRLNGRLVAAFRARPDHADWEIGRLMVAPDLAGAGIGRALLVLVESLAPDDAQRFVLFAGARSERNLQMYERAGYLIVSGGERVVPNRIVGAVHLHKRRRQRRSPTP